MNMRNKCAKFHKDSPSDKKVKFKSPERDWTFGDGCFCVQLSIETLCRRATSMAHLTNFSFEIFYEIFTEHASLLFLYHGAKSQKWPKTQIKGETVASHSYAWNFRTKAAVYEIYENKKHTKYSGFTVFICSFVYLHKNNCQVNRALRFSRKPQDLFITSRRKQAGHTAFITPVPASNRTTTALCVGRFFSELPGNRQTSFVARESSLSLKPGITPRKLQQKARWR